MAILKALLIGGVKDYGFELAKDTLNKPWKTAMFKVAQVGEVEASELGFVGDSVADRKHHGGVKKAIFANSYENYAEWEKFLEFKNLPFGAMGENLTISGLDENSVCVGDIHQIGTLVLRVTQPRKPCFKLSKRWLNEDMASEIFKTGRTGWYYEVLKAGSCKAGDEIRVVKAQNSLSIMQINRLFYAPNENLELMERFLALEVLPSTWHDDIKRRMDGVYDTSYMRNL
ncbi:MOSC domain-containing protein [Campylobacter sp. RM13119]|uniref:MOSC domain-containing protein n=1 Tax=Campylobacter californiensis TaxID=1032243 RepID=UPI00147604B8|nr:MOSC domain-containing protein [Campylobacter sp. RM13119]MBE3606687.1 MOSC domain-containing protein [Campylobacter sp. RM13119]